MPCERSTIRMVRVHRIVLFVLCHRECFYGQPEVFFGVLGNGFFSAARLNARLEDLMREPEGTSSALAGLRHDTMRQERLKMTVGKIAGPTVRSTVSPSFHSRDGSILRAVCWATCGRFITGIRTAKFCIAQRTFRTGPTAGKFLSTSTWPYCYSLCESAPLTI